MGGRFEILWEPETGFLFHLTGAEGTVVAVSPPFATLQDTKSGIEAVRENAATGHVTVHPGNKQPDFTKPPWSPPIPGEALGCLDVGGHERGLSSSRKKGLSPAWHASTLVPLDTDEHDKDFRRLHQLITETRDLKEFLTRMTRYAASTLSRVTGARIECAVTLHRRKRRATIAGSSATAILLDEVEQALGDGPLLEALETLSPVLLADTCSDERWPEFSQHLSAASVRSVLGVPLALGPDASAALDFFAANTGLFTDEVINEAVIFADIAAHALRSVVRIATADLLAADRKAAMEQRTAIDIATGIIMAQNQCGQDEASAMLLQASQNRNEKLHDLARGILRRNSKTQQTPDTHFDN